MICFLLILEAGTRKAQLTPGNISNRNHPFSRDSFADLQLTYLPTNPPTFQTKNPTQPFWMLIWSERVAKLFEVHQKVISNYFSKSWHLIPLRHFPPSEYNANISLHQIKPLHFLLCRSYYPIHHQTLIFAPACMSFEFLSHAKTSILECSLPSKSARAGSLG